MAYEKAEQLRIVLGERLADLGQMLQERDGLTDTESQELRSLVRLFERCLLVRAQGSALLKQRGHDVSGLLDKP